MGNKKKETEADLDKVWEMYDEASGEYYKKFGEFPPAVGYGFNPDLAEYVKLIKRSVNEGKKIKVEVPDWYKDVIF